MIFFKKFIQVFWVFEMYFIKYLGQMLSKNAHYTYNLLN